MEGTWMVVSLVLIGVGRYRGSPWCFRTKVQWMATWYLGGISNCGMAERDISVNACQCTSRVSQTWQRQSIQWGIPAPTWKQYQYLALCTSSSTGGGICLLPPPIRHLNGCLMMILADHWDIMYMYAETVNNERTEMPLKFRDSPNPSVFVTTPKVGGTGLNVTAAKHLVIKQKFWVLNEQHQAYAQVVQLGQNRVPHTWVLNTGPSGYVDRASDLHQLSGVAQMQVLHGLMSRPNITTSMTSQILEYHADHTKQCTEWGDIMLSDGVDEQ